MSLDETAFNHALDRHRRELHVHCYRMLGSLQDAEDALQDTLLAAWRGFAGYQGDASIRTWLYRIATNTCLNGRRAASRRPPQEWNVTNVQSPDATQHGEVPWLEPYPDALLESALGAPPGPEARYAWQSADLDTLVVLLTDDVFISMPPMPFEYTGREVVAQFCGRIFGAGRRFDLVPTRANGQPAFGTYLRGADGLSHGVGMIVLELREDGISAMTRFENSVLAPFGLPRTMPSRPGSPR